MNQAERFSEAESRRSGPAWLTAARRSALARFTEVGFPTDADEDWRFTRVDPIAKTEFGLPSAAAGAKLDVAALVLAPFPAYRLVFVDGTYAPALSDLAGLPPGVRVASLAAVLKSDPALLEPRLGGAERQAFAALNTAFFDDGAFVSVPRGVTLEKPVHALFLSTGSPAPTMWHGRVVVSAEAGSKLALVEEYVGAGPGTYFANLVTDLALGEDASVEHVKVQHEGEQALHVATLRARQERHSRFTAHSVSLGAALSRNDLSVTLAGEGAECSLDGLYQVGGRQHADFHTVVDHAAAHCTSRELFKGVLDGRSRAVFNGMIVVQPGAQKTSASVYNKNLVLSEHSVINTKPEFKIHANDVQCKHGATVGQLSDAALFYLRSRGIGAAEARRLLVYAFAREMVEKLPVESLREALSVKLSESLGAGG
ncbi:MAG: sufD [Elusimicrobia bacterium]|nr:MAG: sufD [Elusimicrobiota bacterium]